MPVVGKRKPGWLQLRLKPHELRVGDELVLGLDVLRAVVTGAISAISVLPNGNTRLVFVGQGIAALELKKDYIISVWTPDAGKAA